MPGLGDLIYRVGADIRGFESNMAKVSKDINKSIRESTRATSGFERLGGKLTNLGTRMSVASAGVALLGVGAIKSFADFDAAMTQSLAIMGDVSDGLELDMANAAREMAKASTFSATQAAESYFFLASAGLDAKESIEALPAVTAFAQAGMFDMAVATDLLTDAQSALGLTIRDDAVANMENMVRVSDVLVKAGTLANATVKEFSESLTNKAGAAMRTYGVDMQEGVAVLAAFADQGVKGVDAGTQFSIVLRDLTTKAVNNKEAFEQAGVAVFDSAGELNNMGSIIGDLESALSGMSVEQQKSTLLMLGFTDKSVAALQALLGTSEAIRGWEADLRSAGGITQEVSEKQLTSISAQLSLFKSEVQDSAIELGKALVPALRSALTAAQPLLEWLGKAVTAFGNLPSGIQTSVIAMAGLAAAIGPVLLVGGQLTQSLVAIHGAGAVLIKTLPLLAAKLAAAGGVTAAFSGLIAVLTGPVGLIALLGVGLVGAAIAVKKNFIEMDSVLDQMERKEKIRAKARDEALDQQTGKQWSLHDSWVALMKQAKQAGIEWGDLTSKLEDYGGELRDNSIPLTEQNVNATRQIITELTSQKNAVESVTTATQNATGPTITFSDRWVDFADLHMNLAVDALNTSLIDLTATTDTTNLSHQDLLDTINLYPAAQAKIPPPPEVVRKHKDALGEIKKNTDTSLDEQKTAWTDFGTDVSTAITNAAQGMVGILIGTQPGSIGDAFKQLGQGVLSSFVEPAMAALNSLIEEGIKKLIGWLIGDSGLMGALSGLGGKIAGVLGVGTGAAGGVAGSVGGVGGGAGVVGGLAGTLSAVGALGSFATGIIGAFQAHGRGKDLTKIEESTRFTAIAMIGSNGVIDTMREFLPYLKTLTEDIFFGQLVGAGGIFGQMHDRLIEISGSVAEMTRIQRNEAVPALNRIRDAVEALQHSRQPVTVKFEVDGREIADMVFDLIGAEGGVLKV